MPGIRRHGGGRLPDCWPGYLDRGRMDLEEVEAVFRRANAEERRARDEGRKPPPALAGVPRVGGDGAVVPDAVEYPLIEFPWEPWTLITPGRRLTQAQAGAYANWVNDARAGRLAVIAAVLEEAGAPSGGLREPPRKGWRGWAAGSRRGFVWSRHPSRTGCPIRTGSSITITATGSDWPGPRGDRRCRTIRGMAMRCSVPWHMTWRSWSPTARSRPGRASAGRQPMTPRARNSS